MKAQQLLALFILSTVTVCAQYKASICDSLFKIEDNWEMGWIGVPSMELQLADTSKTLFSLLEYPPQAVASRIEGDVFARVYVDTTGKVQCLKFIRRTNTVLDSGIEKLLYSNPFRKQTVKGNFVPYFAFVPFRFRLDSKSEP